MELVNIKGKRAKKFGSGFTGGYNVIHYPKNFGGHKIYGKFKTKKEAQKLATKIRRA